MSCAGFDAALRALDPEPIVNRDSGEVIVALGAGEMGPFFLHNTRPIITTVPM